MKLLWEVPMVVYLSETATVDGIVLRKIREGGTFYFVPDPLTYVKDKTAYLPSELPVFYNPVMEINRDISILALRAYARVFGRDEIFYVEALAGTGIRAFRALNEVEGARVLANDISRRACSIMKFNKEYFEVPDDKLAIENKDANLLLLELDWRKLRPDAVEIDPYGTPAPFLFTALKAIKGKDGLLLITATDTAPLVGKFRESALRKYGTILKKTPYSKEIAVRALLYAIGREASLLYKRARPLFGIFTHHFIKLGIVLERGKRRADMFWRSVGWLIVKDSSVRFEEFDIHHKTDEESLIGPLFISTIFDSEFVEVMLDELKKAPIADRNKRALSKILSWEISLPDIPLFFEVSEICKRLKINVPPIDSVVNELRAQGYRASRTHFSFSGVRTDAPESVVIEVIKELSRRKTLQG